MKEVMSMEDRYLYKAKRLDNGEWVIGSLITCKDGTCKIATSLLEGKANEPILVCAYDVDRDAICQCTAMPDKNKKLVFEHDIVWDSGERAFYEIIWNQEDMCWNVEDADGHKSEFEECYGSTLEVNGNRFDNAGLLESE